jgi:hypothetical protein
MPKQVSKDYESESLEDAKGSDRHDIQSNKGQESKRRRPQAGTNFETTIESLAVGHELH